MYIRYLIVVVLREIFFFSSRYITLAPGEIANLSGIRTFRVFRALRTISAVKGWFTVFG